MNVFGSMLLVPTQSHSQILFKQATIFLSRFQLLLAYLCQLSSRDWQEPAFDRHQSVCMLHRYLFVNVLPIHSNQVSISAYVGRSHLSLLHTEPMFLFQAQLCHQLVSATVIHNITPSLIQQQFSTSQIVEGFNQYLFAISLNLSCESTDSRYGIACWLQSATRSQGCHSDFSCIVSAVSLST